VDPEEPAGRAPAWPPSHPSPPPPPPREYGSPGTEPPDRRWLWGVLGGAVAITLFAGGGLWLVTGSADDQPTEAAAPSTTAAVSPSESAAPEPSPVAEASTPPPSQVRCWDASTAPTVEQCSMPEGAAGLAWVFPQLSGQQCRPPKQGRSGAVVQVLCSATLPDGTTVKLGYYQWSSVDAGLAYYDAQGLNRNDVNGFHGWAARLGNRTKKAVLYAEAPYSRTLMFRTAAADSPELQHLEPRPPDRLRGEPVG